jgi:hypothetical protein
MEYPDWWPARWKDKVWEEYCFDGNKPNIVKYDQETLWAVFTAIPYGVEEVEKVLIAGKTISAGSPLAAAIFRKLVWAKLIKWNPDDMWWDIQKFPVKEKDYE